MRRLMLFLLITIMIVGMIPPSAAQSIYSLKYENLDGKTVSFDQYSGKKLIVEAFSSVCTHCQDFHPKLKNMYDEYNSSLTLLSISINPDDTASSIKTFEQDYNTTWEIGLEKDDLNSNFGITGTPTTMMFDGSGNMKVCIVGDIAQVELMNYTQSFVSNPNYSNGVQNGMCPQGSLFDQFMGSIFFPITAALIFYAGFFGIRKYFNNARARTTKEEIIKSEDRP